MGRYAETNYPEGYEGDYYIVTDSIDEAFDKFIVEDDIAEPAIYAETVEKVGRFVSAVDRFVKVGIETTSHCPLCMQHDNEHFDGCPMLILWQLVEVEEEPI